MVDSSFYADGPTNTGAVVASPAAAAFYADPAAAAASAQQAASAAVAAASAATAASTAAAAAVAASSGKANIDSPTFTGAPSAPSPSNGDSSTRLATTAWVQANAVGSAPATTAPVMDGTAAIGVSAKFARADHVHPTDTSRASVAYVDAQLATAASVAYVDAQDATKATLTSPAFTGTPTAPTASAGTSTTQLATTAFVTASPAFSGTPTAPTPATTDNSTKIATTAYVKANAPSASSNSLSADVLCSVANTFYVGPTVAQGTTGTFFAVGTVTLYNSATDSAYVKLWDGTTLIASALFVILGTQTINAITLSGLITNPTGNIRIEVKMASTTTGKISANLTGLGKDSGLTVLKIG